MSAEDCGPAAWSNWSRLDLAWDRAASVRHKELVAGSDKSYVSLSDHVSRVVREINGQPSLRILDAGCGLGFLAHRFATQGHSVVGIDFSARSIALARSEFGAEVEFLAADLTALPEALRGNFDVVVANMALHNVDKLEAAVASCAGAVRGGGHLISTITDPQQYLIKHGVGHPYDQEGLFMFPVKPNDSSAWHPSVPYFHRSLRDYIAAYTKAGFNITQVNQPKLQGGQRAADVVVIVGSRQTGP